LCGRPQARRACSARSGHGIRPAARSGRGPCCGPWGAADWPDAACVSTTLSGGAL
jgi:hypothetical protein